MRIANINVSLYKFITVGEGGIIGSHIIDNNWNSVISSIVNFDEYIVINTGLCCIFHIMSKHYPHIKMSL